LLRLAALTLRGPSAFLVLGIILLISGVALGAFASALGVRGLRLTLLHGDLLVFGAIPMIVTGFALRLLPRFFGTASFHGLLPAVVLLPIALSAVLRVVAVAAPLPEAAVAAAALTAAGGLVFAGAVLRTVSSTERQRDDGILFVLAALWLPAAGAFELAEVRAAALDAALWGFAGGHIVAVYARTAPAFIAARPSGPRALRVTVTLWHAGVAAAAFGQPAAWAAVLAGALVLVSATRLYGSGIALRPIPPGASITRTALRLAFAWLVVALGLLSLRGLGSALGLSLPIDTGGARHAFTLGFLLPVIYAYGVRLVPLMMGGPQPVLRAVVAIVALANVGVLIRVVADATIRDASIAAAAVLISATAAGAALVLFITVAIRSMRRGGLPLA